MKKGDFERENYHLYSSTPPNASKYTRGCYNHDTATIHHNKCKFGLFGLFLGECGHFQGSDGMKKQLFLTQKLSFVLLNTSKCPHIPP